jgi:hypothetical protein
MLLTLGEQARSLLALTGRCGPRTLTVRTRIREMSVVIRDQASQADSGAKIEAEEAVGVEYDFRQYIS